MMYCECCGLYVQTVTWDEETQEYICPDCWDWIKYHQFDEGTGQ